MKVSSILKFSHEMMSRYIHKHGVVVDATCGNGNDLLFIAQQQNKQDIYAFDIQEDAILKSKQKCNSYTNIKYINDSHANIKKYINKNISLATFNLGYLPNSKSNLSTTSSSTITALNDILDMLKQKGAIVLTIYTAHDNHEEESEVIDFIKKLSKNEYNIVKYEFMLLDNAPYTIVIEKK